jgi:hypothetical protein
MMEFEQYRTYRLIIQHIITISSLTLMQSTLIFFSFVQICNDQPNTAGLHPLQSS